MTCDDDNNNDGSNKNDGTGAVAYKVKACYRLNENTFLVVGTNRTGRRLVKNNKNMIVLRHGKQLTLVNPIRLDAPGEAKLCRLGTPARMIRLAPRQGQLHDRYYLHNFPWMQRWAPPLKPSSTSVRSAVSTAKDAAADTTVWLPVHRFLMGEEEDAILPGCHFFSFQETAEPECALIIYRDYHMNILITAEALQAHRNNPHINMPARTQLAAKGMTAHDVVIPPPWIRGMQQGKGHHWTLRRDLEALLRLDFDCLVGSRGVMVQRKAKEKAVLAVERSLPVW